MKATQRHRARSRKIQSRPTTRRRWTPQCENLEARQLLAADLIFKTTPFDIDNNANTPNEPFTFSFQSLDFDNGNILITNWTEVDNGGEGELLYQATLRGFTDTAGNLITNDGGINVNYEVTAIMRARVGVNADGQIALTMPQNSTSFGLEIYYNDIGGATGGSVLDKSDNLLGTGFDDGTLIMKADVTSLLESTLLLSDPPFVTRFDQVGADNYAGLQTRFATGGFSITADPTYVNPTHIDVRYGSPLHANDLNWLFFDFNVQAPFTNVNPSKAFFAEDAGPAAGARSRYPSTGNIDLGNLNGTGPNLQLEADSAIAITLREGSIHGFKYEDMIKNGVYDQGVDPPLAGVKFELIIDADRDGVLDAGETKIVATSTTDAKGEYHFENLIPGYYIVREVPNTPNNEVKPSTPTTFGVFVCAGEEHAYQNSAAYFGSVAGRGIYYNRSSYDNNNGALDQAGRDLNDLAIATDKVAYLPGSGLATSANYTSYQSGINGIYVDIVNGGIFTPITIADFEFKVGTDNNPSLWGFAPLPVAVQQELGAGVGGSTRVYIEWADGAIRNQWLRVKVLANDRTRILTDDIHFWGNQVGEALNIPGDTEVDGTDIAFTFANFTENAGITNPYDYNRDGRVDGVDVSIQYANFSFGTPLLNNPTALPPNMWHLPTDIITDNREGLMFGNYVVGSIHGFKFDDYEGDGIYNPNGWDLPFGGIEFQLTGYMYNPSSGQYDMPVTPQTVTSDHGGEFWFTGLAPGLYTVTELQPGWSDVMPSPGNNYTSREIFIRSGEEHVWKAGAAMLPSSGTLREEVLLNPNQHGIDEGLIFGNFVKGSIHGFKFEDDNGNGVYDGTDTPWAGIKFRLWTSNANGDKLGAATHSGGTGPVATDANGEFWFTGVVPGYYVLEEILPPDLNVEYVPTRPAERLLFVGSREELVWAPGAANLGPGALQHEILHRSHPHPFNGTEELVFGNYIPGSIHGMKFEDLDGDGVRDFSTNDAGAFVAWTEPPMANVTIFLSGKDGMNNDVNLTTVTDADGEFWFMDLKPGTYTVSEKAAPVGFDNDDTPTLVGLKDQGELLNGAGEIAFPVDNVMMSAPNSATFTITSRDEYVWKLGAGKFQDLCFTDNPGLVEVTGENANLTHVLCNGEMATHKVVLNVPMPSDAYHVTELEVIGMNGGDQATKDGGPARWTGGTFIFGAPGVAGATAYTGYTSPGAHPLTGTGLKFEVKIEQGKVRTATQTSTNTNSLVPNFAVTNPVSAVGGSGTGFKVNVTVNASGTPSWTIADQGINYVNGDVVTIPFNLIGGQTSTDNIIIRIDQVESKIVDLKPTGNPGDNPDTEGPDANILMSGKAYEVGDMFTIRPNGSVVGDVLTINTTPVSQGSGYGAPGQAPNTFTYTGVSVVEAGGLKLNVTVDTNPASPTYQKILSVAIHTRGSGYTANQLVTIKGTDLDAGSNDDVKVRINTVGDDRVMLKVIEVGNTTLDVALVESSDDWGQSEITSTNPVVIDSLTGGNPTQQVSFDIKITGKGYDDVINYKVTVDGVDFSGDLFVDGTDVDSTFHIGVNNGTLRKEILTDGLVFANIIKGSIHGYKFHDTNLDGIENGNDEPFNGVEFSLADANGNYLLPDFTFEGGIVLPAGTDGSDYLIYNGRGTGTSTHGTWEASTGMHNTPGSALSQINNGNKTESITILAFTPFSAGVGFSKMVQGHGSDTLSFYIDDVLQGTWSGSDNKFTDAWYHSPEHPDGTADGWGWHKYTWTFSRGGDVTDNPTGRAWIDDIRFTAMTGANPNLPGEFWIEDVSPGNYKVIERLDLVGQFQGEVMPSFMNVSQWATTAVGSSEYNDADDTKDMLDDFAQGAPDDKGWSPSVKDAHHMGPLETLLLSYDKAVFASSVVIDGVPGFSTGVTKIEINEVGTNNWHQIPNDGVLKAMPDFMSNQVRLTVDTDTVWNEFEKIDAVQLNGMMMTKDEIAVTVRSGEELVWKDGAAMLPTDMCGPAPTDGDVVFVIDVSGSTFDPFPGASVGDLNNDGFSNTILDGEIAAFIALNQQLISVNPTAKVSIVQFSGSAQQRDMDLSALGTQLFTTPAADTNSNGIPDVEDVLRSLAFGGATNFEFALQQAINTVTSVTGNVAPVNSTVVFISDGINGSNDFSQEVTQLNNLGVTLRAFGINQANLTELQEIDPNAMVFTSPTELQNFFGGQNGGNNCQHTTLREEKNIGNDLVFANLVKGSIHAFKFEDIDADGVYETGSDQDPTKPGDQFDTPWAGWTFELFTKDILTGDYTVSRGTQVTNANGEVWFTGLKPGQHYKVVEKGPSFAVNSGDTIESSTGDEITGLVSSGVEYVWKPGAAMLDANSPSVKEEFLSGSTLMFGNYVRGSIHGFKFEDYRGDGIYRVSDNDKPFGGITFELEKVTSPTAQTGTPIDSVVTNKDGEFWFTDLVPGWYRIRENYHNNPLVSTTHPDEGWTYYFVGSRQELAWKPGAAMLPTSPDVQRQELVIGTDLYYGNAVTGSIHGFKCEDVDADGKCETTGHVVFVIDASDTMQGPIAEIEQGDINSDADDIPGDQNGDGLFNRKFDAQIVAVADLLSQLPALPPNSDFHVGVVAMINGVAVPLDVSPAAGTQLFNSYTNATEILNAIKALTPAGDTNFDEALTDAAALLAGVGAEPHRANVYFLSDGFPNVGDIGPALSDEVAALATRAGNIVAAGIGQDATLASLSVIDAEAVKYPTMSALSTINLGTNFKTPELPMANVDFVLTGTTGLGVPVGPITVTTGANGEFEFLGLFPGTYTVTEQLPAGWASSTGTTWTKQIGSREEYAWAPGEANLQPGSMKVEILDEDLIFGNYIPGSIHGYKFNDIDADGVFDAGEPYLGGVAFQLYRNGSLVNTAISGLFTGRFSFNNLVPGTYEVREVDVPGDDIVPTTHTSTFIKVESGQAHVWSTSINVGTLQTQVLADGDDDPGNDPSDNLGRELIFGNTILGSLHGFKYEDYLGDGIYDSTRVAGTESNLTDGIDNDGDGFVDNQYLDQLPDRPGLQIQEDLPWANFPFEITGDFDGDGSVTSVVLSTNANGEFHLTGMYPGTYTIREMLESVSSDVVPVTPASITVQILSGQERVWRPGAANLAGNALQNEVLDTRLAFANAYEGSIHGCVFLDQNGNGQQDLNTGENTQNNVPVRLFESNAVGVKGTQVGSMLTQSLPGQGSGHYWFTGLEPGWYLIEVDPTAASMTTDPHLVFVGSREELVHRDGVANLGINANQHEVNVSGTPENTLIGIQAPTVLPAIAGALLGISEDMGSDVEAVDEILAVAVAPAGREVELSQTSGRRSAWTGDDYSSDDNGFKTLVDEALADLEDDDFGAFLA